MDYCELGIEIETPAWLFLLLILFFIAMLILWFIATIKGIKAYRERTKKNKPKEDELQKLLNAINDRIIDLSNANKNKEMQIRKCDFNYFKGMILGLIEERKDNNE